MNTPMTTPTSPKPNESLEKHTPMMQQYPGALLGGALRGVFLRWIYSGYTFSRIEAHLGCGTLSTFPVKSEV
jgi:hypothetical protein